MADIESGWPMGTDPGPEPPAEQQATGAMRWWLVHGTRKFAIDQRRRFGRHGESRRLLAVDAAKGSGSRGSWHDVVAALQRQAVHSALAQLRKTDRQILTLAYLQGHTNREIAVRLGVSVRTVSRRLAAALARLDALVRHAGVFMASVAVVWIGHLRAARWPGGMSTAAAATATVMALGVIAVGTDTSLQPRQATHRPGPGIAVDLVPPATQTFLRVIHQPASTVVEPRTDTESSTSPTDRNDTTCQVPPKKHHQKPHPGRGACRPPA